MIDRRLLSRPAAVGSLILIALTGSTSVGVAAAGDPPVSTAAPVVTGVPREGESLTASPGSWVGEEPISSVYQWRRCEAGYSGLIAAADPIGYGRLGESSGSTAVDDSGRAHSGL